MKLFKIILLSLLALGLIIVFFVFDPSNYSFFPKCPFLYLTGFTCPGCGSQRAIHDLLHLNLSGALKHNPFMVLIIPYFLGAIYVRTKKKWNAREKKIRKIFYGAPAIWTLLVVTISFWIGRNIF